MKLFIALLISASIARAADDAAPPRQMTLTHCLVTLIEQAQVPAQEAGLLIELRAREGASVKSGDVLALINDTPIRLQKEVAESELRYSMEKATNDVNVRYAEAVRKVAAAEYQLNRDANLRFPGTKSAIEIEELLLSVEQATLQIEQAEHDQLLARIEAQTDSSRVKLADDDTQRRRIISPLTGSVVETFRHVGEWVPQGDPVLHVVRMDKLRVEGFVKSRSLAPTEVQGKLVEVTVHLERTRIAQFEGRIVFVDPRVQAGGDYRIWAEIHNRQHDGQWLLRPGLEATMTIYVADAIKGVALQP